MSELDDFLRARDHALMTLDENYVVEQLPGARPEIPLMILHKARYECVAIPRPLRLLSAKWLREQNCKRMDGSPILPNDELPT